MEASKASNYLMAERAKLIVKSATQLSLLDQTFLNGL
jgi:hypothetical protein